MTFQNSRLRRTSLALLTAGSLFVAGAASAVAQTPFTTLDSKTDAQVRFSASDRGAPVEAGSTVNVAGRGFEPGQQVSLLYGTTPLAQATANEKGEIATQITIPANASAGIYPVVVLVQEPYYATIAELKVSPTIPLSGQDQFQISEAQVTRGLYQSAYSAKNNAIFVTSSVGRPPVKEAALVKLDADSLDVLAQVTPASAPASATRPGRDPGLYAVYGVGVDDAHDTVWVTNTRQNTVAVYNQSDLSLVKQFAPDTVAHARDVLVDETLNKAFASATGKPEVVVFDTATPEVSKTITIDSKQWGEQFSSASLSLDQDAHRLYVASLSTNEVAVIDTQSDEVEKVLPVPGAKMAIGIAHDPGTNRIFVAASGSDNLIVLDGDTGDVIADTPIGAMPLNVAFDPQTNHVYVASRVSGSIAVADVNGNILANLGPAPMANHVALGKDGVVYAVDKSAGALDTEGDRVLRISPRK
ncbi:YncE family protein [Altericroceibacterium spongiae]|uniref:YncE family protein n=1 Tax=Altericroceibacterium spongiae TaxID=2320269 RepID=A0A420EAC5_9SPHN|nr:YncE family protein [Altericroceibacterium spongiae]RKF17602.1 YncE family protein [Altericroceibacterium spongiae]